jgi:hypothetical protein
MLVVLMISGCVVFCYFKVSKKCFYCYCLEETATNRQTRLFASRRVGPFDCWPRRNDRTGSPFHLPDSFESRFRMNCLD